MLRIFSSVLKTLFGWGHPGSEWIATRPFRLFELKVKSARRPGLLTGLLTHPGRSSGYLAEYLVVRV